MRGEYLTILSTINSGSELPPRARRIHVRACGWGWVWGTTSACAENTATWRQKPVYAWNYLRVRGEYVVIHFTSRPGMELPPRARRIPSVMKWADAFPGTTSACAENTSGGGVEPAGYRNYLRVRGEYGPVDD